MDGEGYGRVGVEVGEEDGGEGGGDCVLEGGYASVGGGRGG